jgi:hypothetical protein
MSIFRNRSTHRSPRPYEQDREEGPPEPRLFTSRQPANTWDNEEEEPSAYQAPGENYRSQEAPQWQEQRSTRVEDMHPRELSFWREERLYEDYNRGTSQTSPLRFILITASLLVIATFSWLAFRWISAPHSEAPPLIYADPNPYKARPDHPGGLQVPYQDRLVYNRLSPESQQPVERLLPQPEQPIAAPQQQGQQQPVYGPQPGGDPQQQQPAYGYGQQQQQSPYPQQQMAPTQQQQGMPPQQQQMAAPGYGQQQPMQQPQQQMAPTQQGMPPQQQQMAAPGYGQQQLQAHGQMGQQQPPGMVMAPPPMTQNPPQAAPATSMDEMIDSELQTTQKTKSVAKKEVVAALSTKSHRIQVATLANEDAAKKELTRIRNAYPELIGKHKSAIQKVEGEAGVCRVLFGPFTNREAAIKQCAKFRTHGFSCIVLNPAP